MTLRPGDRVCVRGWWTAPVEAEQRMLAHHNMTKPNPNWAWGLSPDMDLEVLEALPDGYVRLASGIPVLVWHWYLQRIDTP